MRLFVSTFALTLAVAACSSSGSSNAASTACNTDPFSCASGQTCWPKSANGDYACLNSAAGVAKGAKCQNTAAAPTCGDAMFCLQLSAAGGTCVVYCDPSNAQHGCGSGEICQPVALAGNASALVHVCFAPGGPAQPDAGGEGVAPQDAGGSDAASD